MPIIFVYGLPEVLPEPHLVCLYESICDAVVTIPELELTKNQVTVFFPPDRMKMDLGKEVIINIFGLFNKPERTPEVRLALAESVKAAVVTVLNDWRICPELVECFIDLFDPTQGFAQFKKE